MEQLLCRLLYALILINLFENGKRHLVTVALESENECKTTMHGQDYTGMINQTRSGRTCQRWELDSPHSHVHNVLSSEENYCRNPDRSPEGPWCYTTDPDVRWEYCDVPFCGTREQSTGTHEPSTGTHEPSTRTPEQSASSDTNFVGTSSSVNWPRNVGTTTIRGASSAVPIYLFSFLYLHI